MSERESILGMRFLHNGFEAAIGRPENEHPPNEWYYIEPWIEEGKFKGVLLNICPEVVSQADQVLASSIESSDGWMSMQILYEPGFVKAAEFLSELFNFLLYRAHAEPATTRKQTMVVQGFSSANAYGISGFNIVVSQQVRDWISKIADQQKKEVIKAMQAAQKSIFPKLDTDSYSFRMWVDGDRFGLSVPGNCACLGVDGMADTEHGLNYELTPHNNDSYAQQMILLAGMAHIWSEVRKAQQNP